MPAPPVQSPVIEVPSGVDDLSIRNLTAGVATGDSAAIERFYRRYFPALYQQARRATRRDESFCLDVVQEAVLRIIRAIRPVDGEAQLLAWLNLVVRTTAYDLLKSERRRRAREAQPAAPAAAPVDEAQLAQLRREIDRLDPHIVRLIDLRFAHGWTLTRIAARLGLSIGTIDGRLRRALRTLRQRMNEVTHD